MSAVKNSASPRSRKHKKRTPGLSLVINTRNEAAKLKKCIKSVGKLADEIIVMDMESSDETVKIAKSLGAKVFHHEFVGYVEPARQAALDKATHDWILLLDADERITPQLRNEIKKIIHQNQSEVIAISRKNIIYREWFQGPNYWPDYQIRFFKNGVVSWGSTIHSPPVFTGEVHQLPATEQLALQHHTHVDPDEFLAKVEAYTNYETSFSHFVSVHGFSGMSVWLYCHRAFSRNFFEQENYHEKFAGYIMSKLMDVYRYAEVAKYWLKHDQPDILDWDEMLTELESEYTYKNSRTFKLWRKYQVFKKKLHKLTPKLWT